jgi:hypothetical protein
MPPARVLRAAAFARVKRQPRWEEVMKTRTVVSFLFVLAMLIAVAAPALAAEPAKPAAPAFPNKVLHVFMCEMQDGVTEEQVEAIAQAWQKAIRQMPGGEEAKVRVLWPVAVANTGQIDFQVVVQVPSFSDWGRLWDTYNDDSPAAMADDMNQGKVDCPDSMMWEAVDIQ